MAEFIDPLAGTPKAATKHEIGVDNATPLEKARRGQKFKENGLWGIKDIDGTILYEAKYAFIGVCTDCVLGITPNWDFMRVQPSCTTTGYMMKEERPYIKDGKAGIKVGRKITVPAEYDYLDHCFGNVYLAVKDGRQMYIDDQGKEVLKRVRQFEKENQKYSPFWLTTDELDIVTAMNYVGEKDGSNPNVVKFNNKWIELERYSKDEIMDMLINSKDDLALTAKNLELLCNNFSYEYSFYFANASGKAALNECINQFQGMGVFSNSWYYVMKIWQAPGEQISAKKLRKFIKAFRSNALKSRILGTPIYAVGHCDDLKPGEIRVLLITHYHERCWPQHFEYEWARKYRTMPITQLLEEVPDLRKQVEEVVMDEYIEEVFNDQLLYCVTGMGYFDGLLWKDAEKALDGFLQLGSPLKCALYNYLTNAQKYMTTEGEDHPAIPFFLKAALWALDKGDSVNVHMEEKASPLDILRDIKSKNNNEEVAQLISTLEDRMISKGAKTHEEWEQERESNNDYFKELEYMRIEGTSEKVMPDIS